MPPPPKKKNTARDTKQDRSYTKGLKNQIKIIKTTKFNIVNHAYIYVPMFDAGSITPSDKHQPVRAPPPPQTVPFLIPFAETDPILNSSR
jgi:hypothetical protein